MNSPMSTPVKQAKLGLASSKSQPMTSEFKKLLNEQHQRLWMKHQQDLDLIDDIRAYVKSRLAIERDHTSALGKLAKHHSSHIAKRFSLLNQCDAPAPQQQQSSTAASQSGSEAPRQEPAGPIGGGGSAAAVGAASSGAGAGIGFDKCDAQQLLQADSEASDSRLQKRLANNGLEEPQKACSLYKVWSEHVSRLQASTKNRADQFEQLVMVADKLKDIRSHKASIGKKCLDTHLKRIHEDILASIVDLEKAKKLYYEDEGQAKKAREYEEKIKKKRSGLLTKFTDLQAKKERTSAQREANDIQSTQARNDYIMALAAANAHLEHYYQNNLGDFIHLIDDGVLDHCKIFMATLSECDINSLKDSLARSQYWSKMINLTGSQKTNSIFLDCDQSACLRGPSQIAFEPYNQDPISSISLEHNADYALQHEIDKWFTWFKKECRNLSQLVHQLETCQKALADGKRSVELNGQASEDVEPKIIELKQQIRKCEAAKLKAQARLKVIKEGGMQIEEWSVIESEIRAHAARAQQELEAKRAAEELLLRHSLSDDGQPLEDCSRQEEEEEEANNYLLDSGHQMGRRQHQIKLQLSKDSAELSGELCDSAHQLASISRSTSNVAAGAKQAPMAGAVYSALADPASVWQDDYASAWSGAGAKQQQQQQQQTLAGYGLLASKPADKQGSSSYALTSSLLINQQTGAPASSQQSELLGAANANQAAHQKQQQPNSMTVQSSSPLSAIVDGMQSSTSHYQNLASEAYKSDFECDYNRNLMRSTASSFAPDNNANGQYKRPVSGLAPDPNQVAARQVGAELVFEGSGQPEVMDASPGNESTGAERPANPMDLLNRRCVALYAFDKTNEDDLAFEEAETMLVLEVSDENWVKARRELTGEEGYVPSSYIRLLADSDGPAPAQSAREPSPAFQAAGGWPAPGLDQPLADAGRSAEAREQGLELALEQELEQELELELERQDKQRDGRQQEEEEEEEEEAMCQALYDYEPAEQGVYDDGLPYLALRRSEVLRVLEESEDDGWCLVERVGTGERGHVPSMLLEELANEEGGDDDDDVEEEEGLDGEAQRDQVERTEPPAGRPDSINCLFRSQAPVLSHDDESHEAEACRRPAQVSPEAQAAEANQEGSRVAAEASRKPAEPAGSSLSATSFIIIEPTPETESRSFEESLEALSRSREAAKSNQEQPESAQIGAGITNKDDGDGDGDDDDDDDQLIRRLQGEHSSSGSTTCGETAHTQAATAKGMPPNVSYSVINEEFILEGPIRRPSSHFHSDLIPHHETPTIMEENLADESFENTDHGDNEPAANEPLDSPPADRQNAPSVVIDSCEDLKRSSSSSLNDEDRDEQVSDGFDEQSATGHTTGRNSRDYSNSSSTSVYSTNAQPHRKPPPAHTNYADISPALRYRAEEFTRQIIEEALICADIGPLHTGSGSHNFSI